jgi:predicted amidohydrolase
MVLKIKIRVAACQIQCIDSDRKGNLDRIEKALQKLKNVDIACFPECSLIGWVNPEAHFNANEIPGADSDKICELAKKYEIMIAIGLAEKDGENLYDSVILTDNRGKILLKHRKIHLLAWLMDPPYTPGDKVSVVDTEFGRIGLMICADTFRKDLLQQMKEKKPDILIIPYGWAEKKEKWPKHGKRLERIVKSVAKNLSAYIIGTDLVGEITNGPWSGYIYGGQSVIVNKVGQLLAVGKDRQPDIIIQDLFL